MKIYVLNQNTMETAGRGNLGLQLSNVRSICYFVETFGQLSQVCVPFHYCILCVS